MLIEEVQPTVYGCSPFIFIFRILIRHIIINFIVLPCHVMSTIEKTWNFNVVKSHLVTIVDKLLSVYHICPFLW